MKKAVIVGLGNTLRGDDGIGVYFLKKMMKDRLFRNCDLIPWDGPISSLMGKLINAEKLVIIDAVEMGKNAGEVGVFGKEQIAKLSLDTHKASIRVFADMFKGKMYIVGVQPKDIGLGKKPSDECMEAYEKVVEAVRDILTC